MSKPPKSSSTGARRRASPAKPDQPSAPPKAGQTGLDLSGFLKEAISERAGRLFKVRHLISPNFFKK